MELGDFLDKFLLSHRTVVISNITEIGWSWAERKRYAELTSMIDFGCNFDEDGICRSHQPRKRYENGRKKLRKTIEDISRCCCDGCRGSIGYINSLPNNAYDLRLVASRFGGKTGFWRSGEGCVLPREYRSDTCLFYVCKHLQFKKDGALFILKSIMTTPWVYKPRSPWMNSIPKPPKTFAEYYNSKRHSWIPYAEMKRMIMKEYEKKGA